MRKSLLFLFICLGYLPLGHAQDTFSIVAADSITGEVGSAGASCVDLYNYPGLATDFLGDLLPGIGAINTQAAYNLDNQDNARAKMMMGDSPSQIISWLVANDAQSTPDVRQYGIVRLISGSPKTAGHTGVNCLNYKNHIAGVNYCIQGNILLNQDVLDSMESKFKRAQGDLACKLMAALQGAKVVGADTRCAGNNSSSLFAFVKVSKPTDTYGNPNFIVSVKTHQGDSIEPIDSLQILFNKVHNCNSSADITGNTILNDRVQVSPNPAASIFTIKIPGQGSVPASYTIRDLLGREILKKQMHASEEIIYIEDWQKGMYFIEITNGTSKNTRKIIKQ